MHPRPPSSRPRPLAAVGNIQFELTTRCNFDCFYCAGRDMPQTDMPYELFEQRLQEHIAKYGKPAQVSLQGEGEPTLHADFFRMAEYVRDIGSEPYTITNGTHKHPERFVGLFRGIGVSVDTLNEREAEAIGRFNLPRVLGFIEALRNHMEVVVHSVDIARGGEQNASIDEVANWCREKGLRHIVQPLQMKSDYRQRYPDRVGSVANSRGRFDCAYLSRPRMRYYTVAGVEMPCCFIKDSAKFPGMQAMHNNQLQGILPACCEGCGFANSGSQHKIHSRTIAKSG